MNSQTQTIDVLIPVYNGEKYIEKCLTSLLNQTYKDINIIVADDGSTDKTAKILENYSKNHSNIKVFHKNNESSISKTRNFLLEKITSPFFTFFDSDDYAEETYLEELMTILVKYDADISFCGKSRHSDKKEVNLKKKNKKLKQIIFMNKQECIAEMISSKLFNGTVYCKLFKTSLLQDIKFDVNIHYGEDLDFCYKIIKNANSFVMTPKKLYHYIVRNGSIVTSKFKESKLTCLDCYEKIIDDVSGNDELYICARSMHGLIAIELLYYTWRDKYKNKEVKNKLKKIIEESIPYIKKNKRLIKINRCAPLVWRLTKIM
jgi:glycosyltransferase involved in cell wall biosynthesis